MCRDPGRVADVDVVCADLQRHGVQLLDGPLDRPWGRRTAAFADPPGFAWAGPAPDTGRGPRRIGRAFAVLMERLGYQRYGAVGNDWGSHISPELGRVAPGAVVGAHVTQLSSFPDGEWLSYSPGVEPDLGQFPPPTRRRWKDSVPFTAPPAPMRMSSPSSRTPSDTLSPTHRSAFSRGTARPWATLITKRCSLTSPSTGWPGPRPPPCASTPSTTGNHRQSPATAPTVLPIALAQFGHDIHAIRAGAERDHANIVSWNTYAERGHFAAHQATRLLVDDIRTFFGGSPVRLSTRLFHEAIAHLEFASTGLDRP
jgi:hypothetical protein